MDERYCNKCGRLYIRGTYGEGHDCSFDDLMDASDAEMDCGNEDESNALSLEALNTISDEDMEWLQEK